ncbi:DUF1850 domain-containing protein [Aquincola sp. S2]|uniref:DUF1850 domain-containing protein n=1 Tax=Pseudaquabacterium terrae TaxID=2732868 RepID=A0ABX2ELN9_9BURK|nr:DUF1850 domain-containing protein [Aquabacterium terrae]NRF69585.1 DUF1850 domain-containing protein [Aquabacterium terrae]
MDVCVALVAGALLLRAPSPVSLHWQHSVEQLPLVEVYHAMSSGLQLREVRGRGLGAGIALPEDMRWSSDGWWSFAPADAAPLSALQLANSRHAAGYRLCWAGGCAALAELPGAFDRPLVLRPC